MLEMEASPDFQELHVHKEAGMASTIVAATYPRASSVDVRETAADSLLLLHVVADDAATTIATPGCRPLATFDVDAVIIGDARRWAAARWYTLPLPEVQAVRKAVETQARSDESYAVVMQPFINDLPKALAQVIASS
jgi:hypothetical protein